MADLKPDPIFQVASGFLAAKHLFVAVELGLFEELAQGSATLEEMSQRTGIPARTLRITADAMVALNFIERQGEQYRNGPLAATFLAGTDQPDLRPLLRFWNRISYLRHARLEDAVRTDEIIFKTALNEQEQRLYSEGVEAVTAGTANALPEKYDFGRHQSVLDLGGGTGSFLLAILRRFDKLRCTLYDLPAVTATTRLRFAQTPYRSRVQIVKGDFFKDPIPKGHDAILVANIIHCFPADRALELLKRVRSAASVAARLLLVDFWTNATHTEPVFAALMAAEFLLTPGRGDVYSLDDASAWFQKTGWRPIDHKPLAGPASLLVAEAV
jgi:hypothetical protein